MKVGNVGVVISLNSVWYGCVIEYILVRVTMHISFVAIESGL